MASVANYTGLITSEHAPRPNFVATVGVVAGCWVDLQNLLYSLPTEFDVDYARWTSLDALGVRIGLDRNLRAISPGLYVQAPPASLVPLSDIDYSYLLHGKIGANKWDGSIGDAYVNLLSIFGAYGSRLFLIDNQDMSITVAIAGAVPDLAMQAALSGGYMQARPAGVLAKYVYPTAPGGPLFGFGVENQFISGFGIGVWAQF